MDLRTLRSFVALARIGHFTRTAADLGVAQPALSKQIRSLEDDLGVRLFDRTRRTVRLSRAGQRLLGPAQEVVAASERLRDVAGQCRDGMSGDVRVGITPTAPVSLLADVVTAFRRTHPRLVCRPTQASSEDLLDGIDRGTIDVALVRLESATGRAGIRCAPIFEERMVVALPKRHPLARRRSVPWRRLAAEPFLMVRREAAPIVHDQILAACRTAGFSPRIAQVLHDVHAVMAIAGAGLGIAVVPASTRCPPTLALRPLVDPVLTTTLGVASLVDADADIEDFVAVMKSVAGR